MAQLPLPLAAVLVTSPRRTLPRRLVVWRQRLGLTGWRGKAALLGVAVATRARSFPGALAEVGGARAEVQVGSSHLGSLVWSQTLGVVLSGLG